MDFAERKGKIMSYKDQQVLFDAQVKIIMAIVEKMTIEKRPLPKLSKFEETVEETNRLVRSYGVIGSLVMIACAVISYFSDSEPLKFATISLGVPINLLGAAMMILYVLGAVPTVIELIKRPYAPLLRLLSVTSEWYFPYAQQLSGCDKKALQYVLTQYKIQRNGFERRGGMLAGSIEKIGLFPAIGAVAALGTTLSHSLGLPGWAQSILFLILAFNLLNFAMAPMLHRMDEVIAILEHSIAILNPRV